MVAEFREFGALKLLEASKSMFNLEVPTITKNILSCNLELIYSFHGGWQVTSNLMESTFTDQEPATQLPR